MMMMIKPITTKRILWSVPLLAALFLGAQDIKLTLSGGANKPVIALPDFRGSGEAQALMNAFNAKLYTEIENGVVLSIAPKGMYPLTVPQTPTDFKPPRIGPGNRPISQGPWLTDWSGSPVNSNYLAFGYAAVQNGRLALFGFLYDVTQKDLGNAQVFTKTYFGSLDEAGARDVATQFAKDILAKFGGASLAGSRIFYVSDRSGSKEIWSMDYDGGNQKQVTFYKSVCISPALSLDSSKIAFTKLMPGTPSIQILTDTGRRLPFVNPQASMNATPEFTPDGNRVLFSSTLNGSFANLYVANADGSNLRRLTNARAVEVEPKVNPKTGNDVVFISGRGGKAQLYKMSIDGTEIERLTDGRGEAANPAWHPSGQFVAFAWTAGLEPGNWSIFVMDVTTKNYVQLTSGARSENPSWAPGGRHLVFSRTLGRSTQLYSMLADGTGVKQLTFSGNNEKPAWTKSLP